MIKHPRPIGEQVNDVCPRIALIHGDQDETVPFTSTQNAAELLAIGGIRKCDDVYLLGTGHSETVLELMLGGETQDVVMEWLLRDKPVKALEDISIPKPLPLMNATLAEREPFLTA